MPPQSPKQPHLRFGVYVGGVDVSSFQDLLSRLWGLGLRVRVRCDVALQHCAFCKTSVKRSAPWESLYSETQKVGTWGLGGFVLGSPILYLKGMRILMFPTFWLLL